MSRYQGVAKAGVSKKVHRVVVSDATYTIRAERLESVSPLKRNLEFGNRINQSEWSGYAPGELLMQAVTGEQLGPSLWRNQYPIAYNPATWSAVVRQLINGELPSDAREGNGFSTYQIYAFGNLSKLGWRVT